MINYWRDVTMSYNFEILGIAPILTFFNYQQMFEQNPNRSKAYLGSYYCTLDGFIQSTELIPHKPNWNWDDVVNTMINFWLKHSSNIQEVKHQLELMENSSENIIVARIANVECLRNEFEALI